MHPLIVPMPRRIFAETSPRACVGDIEHVDLTQSSCHHFSLADCRSWLRYMRPRFACGSISANLELPPSRCGPASNSMSRQFHQELPCEPNNPAIYPAHALARLESGMCVAYIFSPQAATLTPLTWKPLQTKPTLAADAAHSERTAAP